MSENILYLLASEKMNRDLYRKYFIEQHLIEEINEKDEMGQTALGEAIDYRNWILVRLMMQSPIRRKTIIHAIGELLSHHWHYGSFFIDKFLFLMIQRMDYINRRECAYLFIRALNNNAWPFVVPFMVCGGLPKKEMEEYFHWTVAENSHLSRRLKERLIREAEDGLPSDSIWEISNKGLHLKNPYSTYNEYKLNSFITMERRKICRGIKQGVRRYKLSYKIISRMMSLYR